MARERLRIGGASGAWGDSPGALGQLLRAGVDVLMMDYLAEVTMSLLARARLKDPTAGYPPDAVADLAPHLPELARTGTRVVTNAGGVNPQGCAAALRAACAQAGVELAIAVVEGDYVLPHLPRLRAAGLTDAAGAPLPPRLLSANAYLGALPIRTALDAGAQIVITGRCADSALALGALMHAFGWAADDYDRLAAGSLVGHVLECGPQATGGLHTDWRAVPDWAGIGYPIADCAPDGSFVLTKPPGTGGLVTPATVAEQVLYEMGDPAAYRLPDVVVDLTGVTVEPAGPDAVRVSGARGRAPGPRYKVSATWADGWRATALAAIVGPDAAAMAQRTGDELLARARALFVARGLADFSATRIEVLGAEAAWPLARRTATPPREAVLRLVLLHPDRAALDLIAREVGSIGLGFAPGTANLLGGRPKPAPQVRLCSFFVDKADLPAPRVCLPDGREIAVPVPVTPEPPAPGAAAPPAPVPAPDQTVTVPLRAVARARSGDKGDSVNIAILARRPEVLPHLRAVLTPERIADWFGELVAGPVRRFDVPGLQAMNFLLEGALDGGGMTSLRLDPLGKGFGQMALDMPIEVPRDWAARGWFEPG